MGGPTGQSHPTVKEHAGGGLFIRLLILSFHSSPPLKSQYCQRQLSPNPAVQQMLCLYLRRAPAPKKELPGSLSLPREATQAGSGPAGVLLLAAACGTRKPGLRKQCTGHMGMLYKNQELHTTLGLTREACIGTRAWNCQAGVSPVHGTVLIFIEGKIPTGHTNQL